MSAQNPIARFVSNGLITAKSTTAQASHADTYRLRTDPSGRMSFSQSAAEPSPASERDVQ
jgi:hypothetical protein